MKIGIVGIGLIGGSIVKRLAKCNFDIYISDRDLQVQKVALYENNVKILTSYDDLDVLIIALPPYAATDFIKENAAKLDNVLITDVCGVKQCLAELCTDKKLKYFGMHPMAGREVGGYSSSLECLFDGANLVVSSEIIPAEMREIISALGFGNIVLSTPEKHDKIIAYTSQLCHIASNAFAQSDTIFDAKGFTGGSFEDLTRVGKLDPLLWLQLFNCNRENLIHEIETYKNKLNEYKVALEKYDDIKLIQLMENGLK